MSRSSDAGSRTSVVAQAWCVIGFGTWSVSLLVVGAIWLLDGPLGLDLPRTVIEVVRWVVGVPGVAGFVIGVVSGVVLLAAQVRAGYREPRCSDDGRED